MEVLLYLLFMGSIVAFVVLWGPAYAKSKVKEKLEARGIVPTVLKYNYSRSSRTRWHVDFEGYVEDTNERVMGYSALNEIHFVGGFDKTRNLRDQAD